MTRTSHLRIAGTVIILALVATFIAACAAATPPPTEIAQAAVATETWTPEPTATALPTDTVALTATPTLAPTDTPIIESSPVVTPTATLSARRPRPNGALLMEEDFTAAEPLAKPLFAANYMSYQSVSGRGLLSSAFRGVVLPVLYDAPQPDDFLMDFTFRAPVAGEGSRYGVIFRSDSAEDGLDHYYFISIQPLEETISLQRWQNEEATNLQDAALPSGLLNPDGLNHVRFEAVGDEFAMFLNDRHVFTAVDDALDAPGALGFALAPSLMLADGEDDFVYFDDIRVYSAMPELAAAASSPTATPETTTAPTPTSGATPTAAPKATAGATKQPAAGAAVAWVRGDQPYGTFVTSTEQVHSAPDAYKLAYDFPAVAGNFVVFQPRPAIALPGKPTGISVWVYGDGSGHFLNAWLRDAKGERRSYTFGPIGHEGWQQMTAWFDDARGWPNGHIDGTDNFQLDFPVTLNALVLDGIPDGKASRGTIFLDDLAPVTEPMPAVTPTPEAAAPPAEGGPAPLYGWIAVPVFAPERATYDIYMVDPTCGCMDRVLDYASQPALSPDGRRLAFRRWKSDDRGVGVMDAHGGNRTRLTNFLEDALPAWSPDARTLIFSSRREPDRKSRIYAVETAGGGDWELHRDGGPVFGSYPIWSSANNLTYHTEASPVGLGRVKPDGSGFITVVDGGSATAPSVSPDSRSLIYMSQTGGSWDIYRINADWSNRIRLTDNPANDGLPAWSPDGRSIAFMSDRSGAWALWIMNADGSNQREIARLPGGPDGRVGGEPDYNTRGWTEERISWGP